MKTLAILTVRNEAAFLLEWLAHHRAVGFTDFLVLSNDCQDGTDEMLDRLEALGWVTHLRNPGPYGKSGVQFSGLELATETDTFKAADWVLPIDIDEFVNIHTGDGTLRALFEALPEATAITLTWRLFGNAGQVRYADAPITDTFTRAAPEIVQWSWRATMFKTLFRNNGTYRKLGVHRPRAPEHSKLQEAQWYDGHGRLLPPRYRKKQIFSAYGQPNFGLVQLNHYPLGAMESYVLKADRGRAVHADEPLGLDYWVERNFNTDVDTSISRYSEARDEIVADLRSDSVVNDLHDRGVAWRQMRFEQLMLEEPNRALFGRLLMAPPSRPISTTAAQFLIRHAMAAHEPEKNVS